MDIDYLIIWVGFISLLLLLYISSYFIYKLLNKITFIQTLFVNFGFVLLIFNCADYFQNNLIYLLYPIIYFILYYYLFVKYKKSYKKLVEASLNSIIFNFVVQFSLICLGFLFLLIYFHWQPGIFGYLNVSDGVNHALMFRGYEFTRAFNFEQRDLYNLDYNRAIHSLVFGVNQILKIEPYKYLTIYPLFLLSFISLLIFPEKTKLSLSRYCFQILGSISYLTTISFLLGFLPQVGFIPFFYIGIQSFNNLFKEPNVEKIDLSSELLIIFLMICVCISIYGLIPLSAFGIYFAVYFILKLLESKLKVEFLKSKYLQLKKVEYKKLIIISIFILILSIPAFNTAYNNYKAINDPQNSFLLTSKGNLINYLNILHSSGTWDKVGDYRSDIFSEENRYSYILISIILLECIIFVKYSTLEEKQIAISIWILFIEMAYYVENPYISSKLTTLVFTLLFILFIRQLIKLKRIYQYVGILILIIIFISPYKFKTIRDNYPLLSKFELNVQKITWDKYLNNKNSIYLSVREWMGVFRVNNSSYFPLNGYMTRRFTSDLTGVEPDFDYIIIDKRFIPEIDTYFTNQRWKTVDQIQNEYCLVDTIDVNLIFKKNCNK